MLRRERFRTREQQRCHEGAGHASDSQSFHAAIIRALVAGGTAAQCKTCTILPRLA
jgi:hypothetical protein